MEILLSSTDCLVGPLRAHRDAFQREDCRKQEGGYLAQGRPIFRHIRLKRIQR